MNPKELKRAIRELKKLKLQCRSGTKERIDLHRKIKALKKQLKEMPETNLKINPLSFSPKEKIEPIIIEENYLDNNGCSYFGYCKAINKNEVINRTCFNPKYIVEKLEKKCSQLIRGEND